MKKAMMVLAVLLAMAVSSCDNGSTETEVGDLPISITDVQLYTRSGFDASITYTEYTGTVQNVPITIGDGSYNYVSMDGVCSITNGKLTLTLPALVEDDKLLDDWGNHIKVGWLRTNPDIFLVNPTTHIGYPLLYINQDGAVEGIYLKKGWNLSMDRPVPYSEVDKSNLKWVVRP